MTVRPGDIRIDPLPGFDDDLVSALQMLLDSAEADPQPLGDLALRHAVETKPAKDQKGAIGKRGQGVRDDGKAFARHQGLFGRGPVVGLARHSLLDLHPSLLPTRPASPRSSTVEELVRGHPVEIGERFRDWSYRLGLELDEEVLEDVLGLIRSRPAGEQETGQGRPAIKQNRLQPSVRPLGLVDGAHPLVRHEHVAGPGSLTAARPSDNAGEMRQCQFRGVWSLHRVESEAVVPKRLISALMGSAVCVASSCGEAPLLERFQAVAPFRGTIDVLTYNIKGSDWPVAWNRAAALSQISAQLRALRRSGRNPQVVLLQESFSADARAIGRNAGYRFVVDGPDSAAAAERSRPTAEDRQFLDQARWWRGETLGKMVGSGLQILSDYPVIRIRWMAFPAFACAGYDCLANKGALLVTLQIPGGRGPIDVLTTHLNSRYSSGVPDDRSLYAYRRQVAMLAAFVERWHNAALPMIAAGDFNAGSAPPRWFALRALLPALNSAGPVREALQEMAGARSTLPRDIAQIRQHGADLEFFSSGAVALLSPVAVSALFGPDRSGAMLSDHIGYQARFRVYPRAMRS